MDNSFIELCKETEKSTEKIIIESIDELVNMLESKEIVWSILEDGLFFIRVTDKVEIFVTSYKYQKTDCFSVESTKLMSTLAPFLEQEWFYIPDKKIKVKYLN